MEKINNYIQQQKEIKPSPYLTGKIMAHIEDLEIKQSSVMIGKIPFWQKAIVAASFAIVLMTGIKLGNSFTPESSTEITVLLVNDNYIELLSTYVENE